MHMHIYVCVCSGVCVAGFALYHDSQSQIWCSNLALYP